MDLFCFEIVDDNDNQINSESLFQGASIVLFLSISCIRLVREKMLNACADPHGGIHVVEFYCCTTLSLRFDIVNRIWISMNRFVPFITRQFQSLHAAACQK